MTEQPLRYLSVCSGVEAATVAWHHMGWTPVGFSEIEPFPSAVLAHHYPGVQNYGDLTQHESWGLKAGDIDLIVGGTPCQAFSVAGLRGGLADARGNLALVFCRLVDRLRPRWVVWENVPGVLSSGGGRDFGSILGALAECGYGFSYRVLDAQYFGVPQRRRRVFVVAHLGDWKPAGAVLFEPESLRGDSAPRRKTRQGASPDAGVGVEDGREDLVPRVVGTLSDGAHMGGGLNGQDAYSGRIFATRRQPSNGGGFNAHAFNVYPTSGQGAQLSASETTVSTAITVTDPAEGTDRGTRIVQLPSMQVRRLTPMECERLQGFPDNYTAIPWRKKPASECPDGPRYKAMGNSMAVPVMRWIGERIAQVEQDMKEGL